MKWFGVAIMSAIMGAFAALIAQQVYPALTGAGFAAVAVGAGIVILTIMVRLMVTAGTITVDPPLEADATVKLR